MGTADPRALAPGAQIRSLMRRLDRATLGDALHGLVGLLDAGRVEDARRAAAQLAALAR